MLSDSQGFVHMVVGNYVIETSVTTAAIIVVLFLAALWLAYSLITQQWGFLAGVAAYSVVYTRNAIQWTRDRRPKENQ